MANIEKQHEIVKTSLFKFVNEHISGADLSVVDEIVLAYVISILEEASQDPCFDVDGFIEMMSAYFPEFSGIDPASVCTWIFQLENQLSSLNKAAESQHFSLKSLSLSDIIPESKLRARPPSISDGVETSSNNAKRTQHLSETSDCGSTDSSGCDFFSDECDVLQEMFPESSFLEVKHCVTIANGDIDRATQILLDRQEAGQSLTANFTNLHAPKNQVIDDNELKNRIISRYSYVDKNAESKEYKPVVPKVEPKKLVRYRDNKIVSLKGERYTDVRRDEEAELKKPKKPICPYATPTTRRTRTRTTRPATAFPSAVIIVECLSLQTHIPNEQEISSHRTNNNLSLSSILFPPWQMDPNIGAECSVDLPDEFDC